MDKPEEEIKEAPIIYKVVKQAKKKPIQINLAKTEWAVIGKVAEQIDWVVSKYNDYSNCDLIWFDLGIDSSVLTGLKLNQKVNHFPSMHKISRKMSLAKNLNKMKKLFPNDYRFYPSSWSWPIEGADLKSYIFNKYKRLKTRNYSEGSLAHPTFIVKPDNMSCGRGIFITNNIKDIPTEDNFLIQEYISKPHLLDKLKYDMRIYVLILSVDPLKIFVYREGIVRFATQEYVQTGLENRFIHLTNYTVNKVHSDFREATDIDDNSSHKRSLSVVLD